LRGLAELIIALLELLEAEARALRSGALRVGLSLAFLGAAGILMLCGVGLILRALYLYLDIVLSPPTATLITGVVTLLVSGGLVWCARRLSR
jgi:Putative Actinobacterial Holin-X, holin superfamily III